MDKSFSLSPIMPSQTLDGIILYGYKLSWCPEDNVSMTVSSSGHLGEAEAIEAVKAEARKMGWPGC